MLGDDGEPNHELDPSTVRDYLSYFHGIPDDVMGILSTSRQEIREILGPYGPKIKQLRKYLTYVHNVPKETRQMVFTSEQFTFRHAEAVVMLRSQFSLFLFVLNL